MELPPNLRHIFIDLCVHVSCLLLCSFRVVTSWIEKREVQSEKANLFILFDKYLPTCLEKLKFGFKKITPIPEVTLVQTLLHFMEFLLVPENTPPDSNKELYELYFVFACIWAFGGAMFQDQVATPSGLRSSSRGAGFSPNTVRGVLCHRVDYVK